LSFRKNNAKDCGEANIPGKGAHRKHPAIPIIQREKAHSEKLKSDREDICADNPSKRFNIGSNLSERKGGSAGKAREKTIRGHSRDARDGFPRRVDEEFCGLNAISIHKVSEKQNTIPEHFYQSYHSAQSRKTSG